MEPSEAVLDRNKEQLVKMEQLEVLLGLKLVNLTAMEHIGAALVLNKAKFKQMEQ